MYSSRYSCLWLFVLNVLRVWINFLHSWDTYLGFNFCTTWIFEPECLLHFLIPLLYWNMWLRRVSLKVCYLFILWNKYNAFIGGVSRDSVTLCCNFQMWSRACISLEYFNSLGSCYDLIPYGSGIEHGASVQHVCVLFLWYFVLLRNMVNKIVISIMVVSFSICWLAFLWMLAFNLSCCVFRFKFSQDACPEFIS